MLGMSAKKGDDSLNVVGWIGDESCLMKFRTGASVTIARPDITAGLPERELTWHMASGETPF
jgi:hypothetical protein